MADEHLFTADVGNQAPTSGRSTWKSCLTGCLVTLVVLIVIAILFGIWVTRNLRSWAATFATEGIRHGIASSQLPAEEQRQIMVQVDRVATAFREKTISDEQLGNLMDTLVRSPLMSAMVTATVGKHYFAQSRLSGEEKTAGEQTLQRFVRGVIDGSIDQAGTDAAMAHVADRDAGGDWKLRERPTDEDLRAFLAEAKKQADAAGVAEQPAAIDPSEEIKRIVDEALQPPA